MATNQNQVPVVEGEKSETAVTVEPATAVQEAPKRFLNGWTKELEVLFAEWADKAACYRWMHEKTGRMYQTRDQGFMFPIIILSTIGGAANFAMNSISQDPETQKYIQLGLGGLSIATGILTTIANRLGYASSSEAHRGASISWGKFNRLIVIELSLHPDERMDAFAFMKMFRIELDRLIEQSPSIPESIIDKFIYEFKEAVDIKKPDITGDLEHTRVFSDSNTRLKKIAEDASLTLNLKKGILKQLVMDDLDVKIRKIVRETARGTDSITPVTTIVPATTGTPATAGSPYYSSKSSPVAKTDTRMIAKIAESSIPIAKNTIPSGLSMNPLIKPEDMISINVPSDNEKKDI
jgi:hypothetical protein